MINECEKIAISAVSDLSSEAAKATCARSNTKVIFISEKRWAVLGQAGGPERGRQTVKER